MFKEIILNIFIQKVHLGLNYHVHRDVWDTMKRKNDSKFVRDLSQIFWGTETLKYKCQDKSKIKNTNGNSIREELTPKKVGLIQGNKNLV